jgi:hypothetical protein
MEKTLVLGKPVASDDGVLLVQVEDNALAAVSGDTGAVGRIRIPSDTEIMIDLKGSVYRGNVVKAKHSLMVLSIGPQNAKVEAVLDSFVAAEKSSSIFENEQLIQGDQKLLEHHDSDDLDADYNEIEETYNPSKRRRKSEGSKEKKSR